MPPVLRRIIRPFSRLPQGRRDPERITLLKRVWQACGEPFPGLARYVRHRLLGGIFPVRPGMHPPPVVRADVRDVAVVIPCHNYGRYLRDAVESVLAQTHPAAEIVIVDDASTDDTPRIAQSFSGSGVRYVRGEWRNVGAARGAGADATTSPLIVFLDADDMLHPGYLACGVHALSAHPDAAIAYSDHQSFGGHKRYHRTPRAFDWEAFDTTNIINAAAMVRREALIQAGGWSLGREQHADWITWRRIIALGWRAVHSDGLLFYRQHRASMSTRLQDGKTYAEQAGFLTERATLCVPLSGRAWAWPLTRAFLETQAYPHGSIHLMILDTSQDAAFGAEVRSWLTRCDYADVTYRAIQVGPKRLADMPRREVAEAMSIACAAIYNTFARMTNTALVFVLEDDVIPPADAFPRLIRSFEKDVVGVSGHYRHRGTREPVCWDWDAAGVPVFPKPGAGIGSVGGTGFGCLVLRGEFLRRHVFQAGAPYGNYDHNFFACFTRNGRYRALIDWDCVCRHYQSPDSWS